MDSRKWRWVLLAGLLAAGLMLAGIGAQAQSGGSFSLTWWSVDGGGGVSSGSSYTLQGSAGQPDAGVVSGSSYVLNGGFWLGQTAGGNTAVYLPIIIRSP